MKAIVCTKPGELVVQEQPIPEPKAGEVRVKIKSIGICGTDIHAYGGNQPFFSYPRVLGHELAGVVDKAGPGVNADEQLGKDVYVIPYLHCGDCVSCRRGKTNCCTDIQVIGVHKDGGMCEYLCVPATHTVSAEGLTYDQLAVVECLAIGAHAVSRGMVDQFDSVMVLGAGPIGLGAAQFAKVAGAKTFIADVSDERLAFCKENYNFDGHVDCKGDVDAQLRQLTDNEYPTVIIDATGNPKAMESTIGWLAHGGRIVFVSVVKADISFNDPGFHKRETTVLGSRNANKVDFEHVVACMRNGSVKAQSMITHKTAFDDFTETFKEWVKPGSGVVKAVIEMAD